MIRKGRLFLIAKICLSFGLLWFLYQHIPMAEMRIQLANIDVRFLPLVFAILSINTFISTLKWQLLLKADSIKLSLKSLFGSYMVGTFFNIFLPSNIGGDSYRMYDVSMASKNPVGSVTSVFADRLSGFLALAILAVVSSIIIIEQTQHLVITMIPFIILGILMIILWGLYSQTPVKWILRITRLNRLTAVVRFADKFLDSFLQYSRQPGVVLKIMALSFGFQFSAVICVYVMAFSLNIRIPFVYFCAFVPIITMMEAIPISIYGVGIRDAGYVFFFGMTGLSSLQTRSMALLYLAITVCYALFGGILWACKSFALGGEARFK